MGADVRVFEEKSLAVSNSPVALRVSAQRAEKGLRV